LKIKPEDPIVKKGGLGSY